MRQGFGLVLVALMPFAGCAFYTATPAPVPPADTWLVSRTEGPVTIGIDPYFDVQRQKAVFDDNLLDEGVLAVRVHVRNAGLGRLVLEPSEIAIELPGGRSLLPSSGAIVAMKLTGGSGSVIGSGIVFGNLGLAVAWTAREQAKADRIKDYVDKELQTVTLSPGESRHGFVYFIGPPNLAFREGRLAVRFVEAEAGTTKMMWLSLAGASAPGVSHGR